ncbi:MAG: sigma-70 family RNA polymerase sigma factor [Desulfobacteraceae bacterium]
MNLSKKITSRESATEITLSALAISGDNTAFEELVRRRQGAIRGLMRQLTGDTTIADDLSQEAFFQAWKKIRSLKKPGAFGGWIRQIAINIFLQYIRRDNRNKITYTESLPDTTVDRKDPSVSVDIEALKWLEPNERLCVVLSYKERLSHREIHNITGLPIGTIKSHINRGALKLRKHLADYRTGNQ